MNNSTPLPTSPFQNNCLSPDRLLHKPKLRSPGALAGEWRRRTMRAIPWRRPLPR